MGDGGEVDALVGGAGGDLGSQGLVFGADNGAELAGTVVGKGDPLGKGGLGAGRGFDDLVHAVGVPVEPDEGADARVLVVPFISQLKRRKSGWPQALASCAQRRM